MSAGGTRGTPPRGHHLGGLRALVHRRHAQLVAGREALLGTAALAVDAHLALADQAEDAGAGHAGQEPDSTLSSR